MLAHLVLFGSGREAAALGVQLGETAGDALHPSVQHAVLFVLRVEVILVALPVVHRHNCWVLTGGGRERRALCYLDYSTTKGKSFTAQDASGVLYCEYTYRSTVSPVKLREEPDDRLKSL